MRVRISWAELPCSTLTPVLCARLARYVRLFIQASPVLCQDIETRLRVDDNIVKTMTIKHKQAAPVVVEKRVTQKVQRATL